jgi:hypothetical protein
MAGKKARCKRCNTPFRIPGGRPAARAAGAATPPPDEEDVPSAMPVDDDEPLPAAEDEPLVATVADDTPPPTPPADPSNPFGFSPVRTEPAQPRKTQSEGRDTDRGPADRKQPAGGGGLIRVAVAAAVFALVAGGVVAGVLVYLTVKPDEQAQAKNEKKDDATSNEPAPAPPDKADAAPAAGPDAKPGRGYTSRAQARGKGGPLALAKVLTFPAKPAAPKLLTEPASSPVPVAVPFAEVRRFFPPGKADGDVGVAWRSAPGFQGFGEKITLTLFSPNSGRETAKVEADGDGSPDPACDLSADGGTFALGSRVTGRVTVWDVRKKQKKLDAFDPYADKPEHKAAKLAAVYLTEPPGRLVTVTTAGAVHVFEVGTKALAGEYVPPKAAAGKVAPGRGVAAVPSRKGVVVAVGGTVYKVDAAGAVTGSQLEDLGTDVGRSLALAVSPGGRVLYAFEADADGKKERAVAELAGGKLGPVFRWPADAGEPVSAGWSGENVATLGTSQGAVVVFDGEGGFRPQAVARTPEDKAVHVVAGTDNHWSLLPVAGNPKGCVAVEVALPLPALGDLTGDRDRQPTASLLLDAKGLSQ